MWYSMAARGVREEEKVYGIVDVIPLGVSDGSQPAIDQTLSLLLANGPLCFDRVRVCAMHPFDLLSWVPCESLCPRYRLSLVSYFLLFCAFILSFFQEKI